MPFFFLFFTPHFMTCVIDYHSLPISARAAL